MIARRAELLPPMARGPLRLPLPERARRRAGRRATAGDGNPHGRRRLVLGYLACYGLWLALSGLALWWVLQVRVNLIDLAFFLERGNGAHALAPVLHHFGMLVLGPLLIAFVLFLEGHLRDGLAQGELWRRAAGIALVLLYLLVLSHGLQGAAEDAAPQRSGPEARLVIGDPA